MSSVMSMVSTIPADRVTVSSCQGSPDVVTLNVVAESLMFPLGVTFVPDHDLESPPYTSCAIVRWMSTVVVVVDCIDPWVNCGVTV